MSMRHNELSWKFFLPVSYFQTCGFRLSLGFVLIGFLTQKRKESKTLPLKPFLSSVSLKLLNPNHLQGWVDLQNAKKYECPGLIQTVWLDVPAGSCFENSSVKEEQDENTPYSRIFLLPGSLCARCLDWGHKISAFELETAFCKCQWQKSGVENNVNKYCEIKELFWSYNRIWCIKIMLLVAVHGSFNVMVESMFSFNVFWIVVIFCGT